MTVRVRKLGLGILGAVMVLVGSTATADAKPVGPVGPIEVEESFGINPEKPVVVIDTPIKRGW